MVLSYLETLKRVMWDLEEGVEAEKTSEDAQHKLEAQSN